MATTRSTRTRLESTPRSPIFLTHPPILANEYRDKLIGACIADPYDPTKDYTSIDEPYPIELRPKIDPKPVDIDNYYDVLNTSSNKHVKATFERIITAFFERNNETTEAREAASAKWWKMETPQENFRTLMSDKGYYESVFALLDRNSGGPVYLVTNILVLSAPKIDKAKASSRRDGASAAVPDPQTHGTTNIVDVGGEVGRSTEGSTGGQFRHEMIVGLGVYEVYLAKPPATSRLRGIFRRKNLDPTILPVPVNEQVLRHLRMGRYQAQPYDGAKFMSHSAEEKGDQPQGSGNALGFALYFPEESADEAASVSRPRS
ncbi:hypothetical protein SCUP234_08343 [Seiridium cupressi]